MKWFGVLLVILGGCSNGGTQGGSGSSASGTGAGASSGGSGSGGMTSSGTTSGGSSTGKGSITTGGLNCLLTTCPLDDGGLACIDTYDDNGNCGGCGLPCSGPGAECSNGTCMCTSPADAPTLCSNAAGSTCSEVSSDPLNCGRCGNVCAQPATDCIRGMCVCPDQGTACAAPDAGLAPFCANTSTDITNCGSCGNDCEVSYATSSGCRFGICECAPGQSQLCVNLPPTSPPTCVCQPDSAGECATPSFATDVYPLLAQQTGAFGCSASGCHAGSSPAGALGFLDSAGQMDAGMAFAELVGPDGGGSVNVAGCDAPVPGAPSTECLCLSRVVAGNGNASVLIDLLLDNPPVQCSTALGMPLDGTGQWAPLSNCALQLVREWVNSGANP